jgi:hypothetical protein
MGMARQLYNLQSFELEIESAEKTLRQKEAMLGESRELLEVRERRLQAGQCLEELKKQQKAAEWEIDDIAGKLSKVQQDLYGGRTQNPKELASLQHEAEGFKSKRDSLEEKALEVMEQVEAAAAELSGLDRELAAAEARWKDEQRQLAVDVEQLQGSLVELKQQKQQAAAAVDAETLECYNRLRRQKGQAVAQVEQGTCRGCRISLSTAELQRAKGSRLVMCSSCGRILFID